MKGRIAAIIGAYLGWNYLVPIVTPTHMISTTVSDFGVAMIAIAAISAALLVPEAVHKGYGGIQRGITGWRQTSVGNAQVSAIDRRVAVLESRLAGAPVTVTGPSVQRVKVAEQRVDPVLTPEELTLGDVMDERDGLEQKYKKELAALDKKVIAARQAAIGSRSWVSNPQHSVPVTEDAKSAVVAPSTPAPAPTPTPAPAPTSAPPTPYSDDSLTCSDCGFKNSPGAPFCVNMVNGKMCMSDLRPGGSDN